MNHSKRNQPTHDEGFYQTGSVTRSRSRGTPVLILLVLLAGAVGIAMLLNVRLSANRKKQKKEALNLQNAQTSSSETKPITKQPTFFMELEDCQEDLTPQQIYSKCIDSVVSVRSDGATGTGLVLTSDGYVLTDYFLVKDTGELTVELANQLRLSAQVIGTDSALNLAVLHVDAQNLSAPIFGDSEELEPGDTVISIGDPLDESTDGTLFNSTVSFISAETLCTEGYHQAGPLLDRFGQVVGFQNGESGYAIPSAILKQVVEQLINQGYVSGRPSLGIRWEQVPELHQKYYALPDGLYVTDVAEGSPLSVGDILIYLNGRKITSEKDLVDGLYACKIGDTVQLELFRDNSIHTVYVTLVEYQG